MNTRRKVWLTPPSEYRGATIRIGAYVLLHPDRTAAISQARRLRSLYRHYRRAGIDPQIARLAAIGWNADRLVMED